VVDVLVGEPGDEAAGLLVSDRPQAGVCDAVDVLDAPRKGGGRASAHGAHGR
jgi:hypothetical protein